ncbi:hypothetical protein GT348_00915 [Aristophania vespae]|uniref:Sorbitol dehydrogenase n=1 Tax=Aristophania vespae TaxID=2697033 RepID=A0A6P1NJL9_9PROT|nr:sugar dehydrogenase complex small subunit [Aristophania vespae]QHI95061.1 hypothetical protein GT348_00915 [Aristophania vespae]
MRGLSRRDLLKSSACLGAMLMLCRPSFAAQTQSFDFLELSEFLTGRKNLNANIAARAYAALTAEDSSFAAKVARLDKTIRHENLHDMTEFSAFASRYPDLQPIAIKIISAWYLGYTGTPSMNILKDDARFVTYENALMYEPTIDATVIPSFSRGHTNYWGKPPSSLATD